MNTQTRAQEIRMQLAHGRNTRRQARKLMQELAILTDRAETAYARLF